MMLGSSLVNHNSVSSIRVQKVKEANLTWTHSLAGVLDCVAGQLAQDLMAAPRYQVEDLMALPFNQVVDRAMSQQQSMTHAHIACYATT